MTIEIPDFAVVLLVGASGSGKSTFAASHFAHTEVLSSDAFRGMVSNAETSLDATTDAFDALHYLMAIRLRRRLLTVIDATNVQDSARKPLIEMARRFHAVVVTIILDVPESVCHARNTNRPDRDFGKHVVARHIRDLRRSVRSMRDEGVRSTFHLRGEAEVSAATVVRTPLWTDKRAWNGPFDIVGDVHGCFDELHTLVTTLGYAFNGERWAHSDGRRLTFLGDLVDRGPRTPDVLRLVMDLCENGVAMCVPGNHDDKLKRALQGRKVETAHGLADSLAQMKTDAGDNDAEPFRRRVVDFLDGLVSHYWLDDGKLVVAHAGLPQSMHGRASARVRDFALYGAPTSENDEFGLPVRGDWAADYKGDAVVVYGHTPTERLQWFNNTINIDSGCVFGGALTALRWPERELVSVRAREKYSVSPRPFAFADTPISDAHGPTQQWQHDDVLEYGDYSGKRIVTTRLSGNVAIQDGNARAALETMSRFAVHPRWLLYLPPTMSPVETAKNGEFLERPHEAFEYFRSRNVENVICQTKHMGSRAVIVVCKDEDSARRRFGAGDGEIGAIVTRTGRPFFDNVTTTKDLLTTFCHALSGAGLWDEFSTDWFCVDAEILPWNAKAQGLLKEQYAPVAAVANRTLSAELAWAEMGRARGIVGIETLADSLRTNLENIADYKTAYGKYCWPVRDLSDVRVAPFHLIAAEGRTFFDLPHDKHIEILSRLASHSQQFIATETRLVATNDSESVADGIAWWEKFTGNGGEGMVVKPLSFVPETRVQPAVKVRGREYLRIIYGPEYTRAENLERLRARGLGGKRSLALREFALGIEAVERFVGGEPLRRVHECVFGVLALESEPIDPRL